MEGIETKRQLEINPSLHLAKLAAARVLPLTMTLQAAL
jgi:hypothetical protein